MFVLNKILVVYCNVAISCLLAERDVTQEIQLHKQNTELALNLAVSIQTTRLSVVEAYEVSNYENITYLLTYLLHGAESFLRS